MSEQTDLGKAVGKRVFCRRSDVLIVSALLLFALLLWIILSVRSAGNPRAVVTVAGKERMRFRLADYSESVVVSLEDDGIPVSFELKEGKIRFIEVTCPDHLCEKTGFIGENMQTAVCLPNKTAVTIID